MSELPRGIPDVRAILEEGQRLGFLGPGPVDDHIIHARTLATGLGPAPESLVDLGSGGGVPGLVLAAVWPATTVVLVEASTRKSDFLRRAVTRLGLSEQVGVAHGRGEDLAQDPTYRERAALVVARSFGPPAATAEIGAAMVAVGGRLAVTEPPAAPRARDGRSERWPDAGLARLGLAPAIRDRVRGAAGLIGFVTMSKPSHTPVRYPRGNGIPRKRPLWS